MNDDKNKTDKDRTLISLTKPYEVSYWCKELRCTAPELSKAVAAVGPSPDRVRAWFRN